MYIYKFIESSGMAKPELEKIGAKLKQFQQENKPPKRYQGDPRIKADLLEGAGIDRGYASKEALTVPSQLINEIIIILRSMDTLSKRYDAKKTKNNYLLERINEHRVKLQILKIILRDFEEMAVENMSVVNNKLSDQQLIERTNKVRALGAEKVFSVLRRMQKAMDTLTDDEKMAMYEDETYTYEQSEVAVLDLLSRFETDPIITKKLRLNLTPMAIERYPTPVHMGTRLMQNKDYIFVSIPEEFHNTFDRVPIYNFNTLIGYITYKTNNDGTTIMIIEDVHNDIGSNILTESADSLR